MMIRRIIKRTNTILVRNFVQRLKEAKQKSPADYRLLAVMMAKR